MAAKRLFDESTNDQDRPEEKRMRTTPSISTVIREAVMVKSFQSLCANLEPLLRRVVQEEVERGVTRASCTARNTRTVLYRSPSMRIKAPEESSFQLMFSKKLSLPLFTGSKIEDEDNKPLQILLVDTSGRKNVPMMAHPLPIKVELVILDGDFPPEDRDDWTAEEFENNIVHERAGKRPLLAGDVMITMRDGVAPVGEIEITDNSSWIRSRNFRIGARVVGETSQGRRIKEAKTERFSVRDHRGELYKKHYPPALDDEVWRLVKIGKEGAFHKKLAAASITTVQDFLKLWVINPIELRRILGGGMSDKIWEGTIKHALTCMMGNKRYLHRGPHWTIVLNPICQVLGAEINGQKYSAHDLSGMPKAYLDQLVGDAYQKWATLEEVDVLHTEWALLQNDLTAAIESHHEIIQPSLQYTDLNVGFAEMGPPSTNNVHVEFNGWIPSPTCLPMAVGNHHVYNTSDLSSDDDSGSVAYFDRR
ncbi:protein SAR DEFICIENT 1 [Magnolia sinica]|uniref:protein SAR DEFICIENT 1 n=1 Tax=Magnolia sinica TaxID=86752 RepID=UPI00265A98D2|nr:protein SAR DEFICIENT 1 [Magnolia sinica]